MIDKKKHFYKILNNIVATNRIDNEEAYIINDYISGLESQLQQKENIIKEVREYIENLENIKIKYVLFEEEELYASKNDFVKELLEILDKEKE